MWINGDWTDPSGDERDVTNPATLEGIATTRDATAEDVDRAVQSAASAFEEWDATDAVKRGQILQDAARALADHRDELVASLVREQGKPTLEAAGEFNHFINGLKFYGELATKVRGTYQDL